MERQFFASSDEELVSHDASHDNARKPDKSDLTNHKASLSE